MEVKKMKKIVLHPSLVILVVFAFFCFTTGCTKTVTRYDPSGNPHTVEEFDAGETLAAILLGWLALGLIVMAIDDTTYYNLLDDDKILLAYEGKQMLKLKTDSDPKIKHIQILDKNNSLISEHILKLDKSLLDSPVINASEVHLSAWLNEQNLDSAVLSKKGFDPSRQLIEAKVSYVNEMPNMIRIEQVKIVNKSDIDTQNTGNSKMFLTSCGLCNISAEKQFDTGELRNQIRISINQIKSVND